MSERTKDLMIFFFSIFLRFIVVFGFRLMNRIVGIGNKGCLLSLLLNVISL